MEKVNDYIRELEIEIEEIDKLISICKKEDYSPSILFILSALSIKKKDKLLKIIK